MRFVVLGAGAVGGVVGARLAEHGHAVVLIARGAHYEAMRDQGLQIESPDGTHTVNVPVADHPSRVAWTEEDVVLLATKTHDTESALADLAKAAPRALPIFCVQNSVANEPFASRLFTSIYGVFVWCPADFLTPGIVRVWCSPKSGILHVGCYPTGTDARAECAAEAFRQSTFYAEAKADIMAWKYRKLLSNLGNAVDALCGLTGRKSDLWKRARREALECYDAAGIRFVSDEEQSAAELERSVKPQPMGGIERQGGSSWQSLARRLGTIETDYLNGAIVELGQRHGIPTPVNALLQRLSQQAAREGWPPGHMSPVEVAAMLET